MTFVLLFLKSWAQPT